jgi:hypothetical protein
MKRLVSILGVTAGALGWIAITACNQTVINTPLRSFDRPSDVALSCAQFNAATQQFDIHPIGDCDPNSPLAMSTAGTDMGIATPNLGPNPNTPFLLALVAQSARGEVAFVDTVQNKLIDADPLKPGFGFVPVGRLPEHIRTTRDGCFGFTANSDSCDLARLEVATIVNGSQPTITRDMGGADMSTADTAAGVVRFRATLPDGKTELLSRPTWIEMAPDTDDALDLQCQPRSGTPAGAQRAWVAFPGCQLVAKLRFEPTVGDQRARGIVEEAVRVSQSGATVLSATDLATLSCPVECAGVTDGGAGPMAAAGTGALEPSTIAVDIDGPNGAGRLVIASRNGERLDIIPIAGRTDHTATLGTPRSVQLQAGALGVSVVRVSPRSEAGKFVYAIARDASVRVVDLDREVECETNPDPKWKSGDLDLQSTRTDGSPTSALPDDPLVKARRLGCLPVRDPAHPDAAAPRRSALAQSPGIQLLPGQLATDVAFVHVDLPPGNLDTNIAPPPAGPGVLVGDFAWIISSDGRATLVTIFDACPAPNQQDKNNPTGPFTKQCAQTNIEVSTHQTETQLGHPQALVLDRLSHRIRTGHARFVAPQSPSDPTGQPRVADETLPFTTFVPTTATSDGGVSDGGVASGAGLYAETITNPALIDATQPAPDTIPTRVVRFPDPNVVRNENWTATWEGTIPGSDRTFGALVKGTLTDYGGAWCSRGVIAGDKVIVKGCLGDNDCDQTPVSVGDCQAAHYQCVRDPGAPADVVTGLCLPVDGNKCTTQYWSDRCGQLLRSQRKFGITSAKQLTGGDQLQLHEIYEPEYAEETHVCVSDADCADVRVVPAEGGTPRVASCLPDFDGVKRCALTCTQTPTSTNTGCGPDFVCANQRCMRAPVDAGLWNLCFPELQEYEIHVGDAFLIFGSSSGFVSSIEPRSDGECVPAPTDNEYARLRNARVPLSGPNLPVCSGLASPLDPMDPSTGGNICRFDGVPATEVVHYENPILSLAMQVPKIGISDQVQVPVFGTQVTLTVVGGGSNLITPLGVDVQAQLPRYAVVAPDRQTVYVIDEGKSSVASGLRGQVLRLFSPTQSIDTTFRVR